MRDLNERKRLASPTIQVRVQITGGEALRFEVGEQALHDGMLWMIVAVNRADKWAILEREYR